MVNILFFTVLSEPEHRRWLKWLNTFKKTAKQDASRGETLDQRATKPETLVQHRDHWNVPVLCLLKGEGLKLSFLCLFDDKKTNKPTFSASFLPFFFSPETYELSNIKRSVDKQPTAAALNNRSAPRRSSGFALFHFNSIFRRVWLRSAVMHGETRLPADKPVS